MKSTTHRRDRLIDEACARHPEEFGLRAYPGEKFKVSRAISYWTDLQGGQPMLYTVRWGEEQGRWLDFAKGTESELVRQKVRLQEAV